MNLFRKNGVKSFWPVVFTICAVFAFLAVFSPAVWAQGYKEEAEKTSDTTEAVVNKKVRSEQYSEMLRSVFSFVEQNYVDELDAVKLYEGAMRGLMESIGDPHTVYLDSSEMRGINDTTHGNFGGVGLSISKPVVSTPEKPAYVEVASPIEDTPGWRAGIQAGDLLVSIDGTATPDITMEEVLGLLRGEVGKPVSVTVRRGKNIEFTVSLIREIIEVPTVKYGKIDSDIGYIRIIEFTPQTPERVQQALDSFAQTGYKYLLIDLRNNPGGLINSAAQVADKFINEGVIVSTRGRYKEDTVVFNAKKSRTTVPANIPIVVLINKGSASASEILSGALKDHHLAYLVGEKTYGKGSVQQVVPLNLNDDGLKLTTARYYTPSDSNIDKVGIPPDREVLFPPLSEEEEKIYQSLVESSVVEDYVAAHPGMTKQQIASYAKELQKTYALELRVLRKIISNEVYRIGTQPIYDLDYDLQLVEAISILRNENFKELMKKTKTISELQAEAKAAEQAGDAKK